jgi:hypothetical protein
VFVVLTWKAGSSGTGITKPAKSQLATTPSTLTCGLWPQACVLLKL